MSEWWSAGTCMRSDTCCLGPPLEPEVESEKEDEEEKDEEPSLAKEADEVGYLLFH